LRIADTLYGPLKPVVPIQTARPTLRSLAKPGIDSLKQTWKPFLLIQLCGLVMVIAYFTVPSVKAICDVAGAWNDRAGVLGAAILMPIMCGIVPEIFKFITNVDRTFTFARLRTMLFHMLLFCCGGMAVAIYYAWINEQFVGVRPAIAVPAKVLLDQLLYTTIIGIPLMALFFTVRDFGWSFYKQLGPTWYLNRVVPLLLPCWAYWFPMCFLMYALPGSLTFVFGAVASAASATLLTATAARSSRNAKP
jgi:hypothetical protein